MTQSNFLLKICLKTLIMCLLFTFYGCQDQPAKMELPKSMHRPEYSLKQWAITDLKDSARRHYLDAGNGVMQEEVLKEYKSKLEHLLKNTFNRHLDTMDVSVKSVERSGSFLSAEFEDESARYYFTNRFKSEKLLDSSEVYKFLRKMPINTKVQIQMVSLDDSRIIGVDNDYVKTFDIKVLPAPLGFRFKN